MDFNCQSLSKCAKCKSYSHDGFGVIMRISHVVLLEGGGQTLESRQFSENWLVLIFK